DSLKATYKTSFQLSPYAFLEVAARAQKWIDQAISRNMYLETRDLGDMMDIYFAAWERGVKTTYYLHMKPRHTAEQSTVKVNKAEEIGTGARKGFGAPVSAGVAELASAEAAAPVAAPRKGFGFGGLAPKSGE
ncbi:MAG: ribonucleoside-diphosphate reductase alpha chain, partial [Microbacteriaceae bacterium]|nr:ribonucleoside-diphosphate reductase alpha chain [Microbacteriaceae bacterium]